jgi:hypothetical protein
MNYLSQCAAAVQDYDGTYRRCTRDSNESRDATIPLCHQHYRPAFRQIASPIADKLERERKRAARHHCDAERAVTEYIEEQAERQIAQGERRKEQTYTYFMRCGRFVKIGASLDPLFRLNSIRRTGGILAPSGLDLSNTDLIATEMGGFERERELHARFSHLRHTGEWFTEAPELTEYIESLSREVAA